MKKRTYVTTRSNGVRDWCGVGNVIVPKDKDRDQYIARCLRTSMVSMLLENGGIVDNVLIGKEAIKDLEFPDNYKTLGSQVIWVNKPRQNQPMIVALYTKNNELVNISRYQKALKRDSPNGVAEVIVNSDKGLVILNSTSFQTTGGDIRIISTNKSQSSQLKIEVSGNVSIQTPDMTIENSDTFTLVVRDPNKDNNITSISYQKGTGFSYKDEFGNTYYLNKDNIQFKSFGKFNIGDGNHAMLLGDTMQQASIQEQDALTTLLNAIKNAPVTPNDGGASFKASIVAAISAIQRGDYSKVLSVVSFTD